MAASNVDPRNAVGESLPYVIISIDFGTTFSGVSWTWSRDLRTVRIVDTWTDASNGSNYTSTSAKVPSKIRYRDGRPWKWGFNLEEKDSDNEFTLEWFKLILDYEELPEKVKYSTHVQSTFQKLLIHGNGNPIETALHVTAHYLRMLWLNTLSTIKEEMGEDWMNGLTCKVMLTKPAIWSQQACWRTKRAAKMAIKPHREPFRRVSIDLISEPEAAAQAVLGSPEVMQRPDIVQAGDIFLVADAGGGTVDVISYMIRRLDPLILEECVMGKGDLCGSIFIDEEFDKFLQLRVGIRRWSGIRPLNKRRVMNDQWENGIKRRFIPAEAQEWPIDIPGQDTLIFTNNHIEPLFQPACGKTRELIKHQVDEIERRTNSPPKAIFLVGGLGTSRYLSYLLKAEYQGTGISIRQSSGDKPWTAVCRGAVMAAAERMNVSRISRCNYGLCYTEDFNPSVHLPQDMSWDEIQRRNVANDQMDWIVRKGDIIAHLRPVVKCCKIYLQSEEEISDRKAYIKIWNSAHENAPRRKDANVTELCTLVCHLNAPFSSLPTFVNSQSIEYRLLQLDIVMSPRGMELEFSSRYNGRPLRMEYEWPAGSVNRRTVPLDIETSRANGLRRAPSLQ